MSGYPPVPPVYGFTDQQKVQIRRLLGYPVLGTQPNFMFGWWYDTDYEQLEYKLSNLSLSEGQEVVNKLTVLLQIETDLLSLYPDLNTSQAGPWIRNKNEISDKWRFFDSVRKYLAEIIGVPFKNGKFSSSNSMRLEV